MKQQDVISLLEAFGFVQQPGKSNHLNFKKDGVAEVVTVPGSHNFAEITPGTLSSIARTSGLRDEFNALKQGVPLKKLKKKAKRHAQQQGRGRQPK